MATKCQPDDENVSSTNAHSNIFKDHRQIGHKCACICRLITDKLLCPLTKCISVDKDTHFHFSEWKFPYLWMPQVQTARVDFHHYAFRSHDETKKNQPLLSPLEAKSVLPMHQCAHKLMNTFHYQSAENKIVRFPLHSAKIHWDEDHLKYEPFFMHMKPFSFHTIVKYTHQCVFNIFISSQPNEIRNHFNHNTHAKMLWFKNDEHTNLSSHQPYVWPTWPKPISSISQRHTHTQGKIPALQFLQPNVKSTFQEVVKGNRQNTANNVVVVGCCDEQQNCTLHAHH